MKRSQAPSQSGPKRFKPLHSGFVVPKPKQPPPPFLEAGAESGGINAAPRLPHPAPSGICTSSSSAKTKINPVSSGKRSFAVPRLFAGDTKENTLSSKQNAQTESVKESAKSVERAEVEVCPTKSAPSSRPLCAISAKQDSSFRKPILVVPNAAVSAKDVEPETKKYYKVLYTKRKNCKRQNKTFQDGVLMLKDLRFFIFDDEGKKIGETRTSVIELKEDEVIQVGQWEVEVYNSITEQAYLSGSVFMAQTGCSASVIGLLPVKGFVRPGAVGMTRGGSTVQQLSKSSGLGLLKPILQRSTHKSASLHSPDQPGALVLSTDNQANFKQAGKQTVAVVVDPYLNSRLRQHQQEGVRFMYECVMGMRASGDGKKYTGALLADEMGLGKTLQCIALMWTLLRQGPYGQPVVSRVIVVCPATLVKNWEHEVKTWLGDERLACCVIQGGQADAKEQVEGWANKNQKRQPVLITSYEMVRRFSNELAEAHPGLLICDEAHRLKKAGGNKTISSLNSLGCSKRILLTGTPIQNQLDEFYAMMDFSCPGLLGPLNRFNRIFSTPIQKSQDRLATEEDTAVGRERSLELTRLTAPHQLRRSAEINAKYLPPRAQYVLFCPLSPLQSALYSRFLRTDEMRSLLYGGTTTSLLPLTAILMLRKLCNSVDLLMGAEARSASERPTEEDPNEGPAVSKEMRSVRAQLAPLLPPGHVASSLEASSKLNVLRQLMVALRFESDRVVVVSGYTRTLDMVQHMCAAETITCCRLDGKTPTDQRLHLVRRFNQGFAGKVFLLSTKAGGAGLNLIGANRLVLFDSDWNPANDLQAMARVWRDGQKKAVVIYRLLCTGTIEEKVYQRQLVKTEMADCMGFGAEERSSGQFSTDDLKDLFTFNKDTKCDTHDHLSHRQRTTGTSGWTDITHTVQDPPLTQVLKSGAVGFVGQLKVVASAPSDQDGIQDSTAVCDHTTTPIAAMTPSTAHPSSPKDFENIPKEGQNEDDCEVKADDEDDDFDLREPVRMQSLSAAKTRRRKRASRSQVVTEEDDDTLSNQDGIAATGGVHAEAKCASEGTTGIATVVEDDDLSQLDVECDSDPSDGW